MTVGAACIHAHPVVLTPVVVPVWRRAGSRPEGHAELHKELPSLRWLFVLWQAHIKGEKVHLGTPELLPLQERAGNVMVAPPGVKRRPHVHGLVNADMVDAHFAAQGLPRNVAALQLDARVLLACEGGWEGERRPGEAQPVALEFV